MGFINKNLMTAKADYEFSVDINNKDNFIRFHHTLENQYNKNTKGGIVGGCTGTGSFLVVRKNAKEYCAKKTGWKYKQGKFHKFKISTKADGTIKIWIDGSLHINLKLPAAWNPNVGTYGLFVAYSQIQFKNVRHIYPVPAPLS